MTQLKQLGRAGLECLGSLQHYAATRLRSTAREAFYAAPAMAALGDRPLGARPRAELEAVLETGSAVAGSIPAYRMERFIQRFVAENVYDRGLPATETLRPKLEPRPALPVDAGRAGTLELDPELAMPAYFEGVEWHLMPGGWDGYDLSGPMFMLGIGPLVFARGGYAAVEPDADIMAQRAAVVGELPRSDYRRIYDAGCGGIATLAALHRQFPTAELVGADLSARLLQNAHQAAGVLGVPVTLRQDDVCASREAAAHYDAVVSYAVFHELDDDAAARAIAEAFRILAPGGDLLISDPGPVRACTPFDAVLYGWEEAHREEPWFTQSILRSLPNLLAAAGFVEIVEYPLGPGGPYPWITRARKPEGLQ